LVGFKKKVKKFTAAILKKQPQRGVQYQYKGGVGPEVTNRKGKALTVKQRQRAQEPMELAKGPWSH